MLRFKPASPNEGTIRVYPGKLKYVTFRFSISYFISTTSNFCSIDSVNDTYQVIVVTSDTSVDDVMLMALKKFALDPKDINRYRMVEVSLEKGGKNIYIGMIKKKEKRSFAP